MTENITAFLFLFPLLCLDQEESCIPIDQGEDHAAVAQDGVGHVLDGRDAQSGGHIGPGHGPGHNGHSAGPGVFQGTGKGFGSQLEFLVEVLEHFPRDQDGQVGAPGSDTK